MMSSNTKRYVSKQEAKKRLDQSYASYKKEWKVWANKGYAMVDAKPMNKAEYRKAYDLARRVSGPNRIKNVAKALASADRVLTYSEAREIKSTLKDLEEIDPTISKISKKVGSVKSLVSNIDNFQYAYQDKVYRGRQAFYLELKFEYGEEEADEVFGY